MHRYRTDSNVTDAALSNQSHCVRQTESIFRNIPWSWCLTWPGTLKYNVVRERGCDMVIGDFDEGDFVEIVPYNMFFA